MEDEQGGADLVQLVNGTRDGSKFIGGDTADSEQTIQDETVVNLGPIRLVKEKETDTRCPL